MVRSIILGKLVNPVVQRESCSGYPAGNAAGDRAKIRMARNIQIKLVKPKHHVGRKAIATWHEHPRDDPAECNYLEHQSAIASEGPRLNRLSCWCNSIMASAD